jgi:hypothetical protein
MIRHMFQAFDAMHGIALKGLTPKKQSQGKAKADHFPAKTRPPIGTGSAANR